jgi:hypothetical protein
MFARDHHRQLARTDYQVTAHLTIPTVGQRASVIGRMQRPQNDSDLPAGEESWSQPSRPG